MDQKKGMFSEENKQGQDSDMHDSGVGGYQEGQAIGQAENQPAKGQKGGSSKQQQESEETESESEESDALLGDD